MKDRKNIAVVGLQRSGTNLMQNIVILNFKEDIANFWKHALYEEVDSLTRAKSLVLLIVKHPVLWLQSCLDNRPGIFVRSRMSFFADVPVEIGMARLYSIFHRGWLDHLKRNPGTLIKYEDVLVGKVDSLIDVLGAHDRTLSPEQSLRWEFRQIPQSVEFPEESRQKYLRGEVALDFKLAEAFWRALDPEVVAELGYRFDSLSFVGEPDIRSFAYRLLHPSGLISAVEFAKVKAAASTVFKNDGTVLYAIGRKMRASGDCADALRWFQDALRATEAEIAEFGDRTPAHMTYLDLLDDIAAVCDVLKPQKLKDVEALRRAEYARILTPLPPAAAEWAALFSDIARRRGKLDEAIRYAREAIEHNPDHKWYRYNLGILLARAERFDEAESELRSAIVGAPRNAQWHFALSDVLARQERIEEAIATGRVAIEGERVEPWFFHHLGALLMKAGDLTDAETKVRCAIEVEPYDARHRFLLSEVLVRQNRLSDAVVQAKEAVRGEGIDAWYFHHLASLQSRLGQYSDAEASLRAAIEIDLSDARHHFLLSDILLRQGRVDEATAVAAHATVGRNVEAWYLHHYGSLLLRTGQLEEAGRCFRQAAEREPDDARHHFVLSDILMRQDRLDDAIGEARKARRGRHVEPWYFHHHASLAARADLLEEAEESLRQAIALDPKDARHHFVLSDVLVRRDRLSDAIHEAERATEGEHVEPWYFHHCSSLLMLAERFSEAEAYIRSAIALDPADERHSKLLAEITARL